MNIHMKKKRKKPFSYDRICKRLTHGGIFDEKRICCNRTRPVWRLKICKTLSEEGLEVMAIDRDEDRVNEYAKIASHAVIGDTTDESVLKNLEVRAILTMSSWRSEKIFKRAS